MSSLKSALVALHVLVFFGNLTAQDSLQINCVELCEDVKRFVESELELYLNDTDWIVKTIHVSENSDTYDILSGQGTDTLIAIHLVIEHEIITRFEQKIEGQLMGMQISSGMIRSFNPFKYEGFNGLTKNLDRAIDEKRILFTHVLISISDESIVLDCKTTEELDQICKDFFRSED